MAWQSTAIVPAQTARPLRHWPAAQLERACGAVERIWRDWGSRWQLPAGGVSAVNACDDLAATECDAWSWTRGRSLWLSAGQPEATVALGMLLFAHDIEAHPQSPVARGLAAEALADLLRSLAQLSAGVDADGPSNADAQKPPAADGRRWSGAVRLRLELVRDDQAAHWTLHCSQALVSVLCGQVPRAAAAVRPPLVDVTDAISAQSLQFKVCLDTTTLTLGTLQSLHVGDVLPLSHRLDQPLHVVAPGASPDDAPFCAAYLGSHDHFRAVELVLTLSSSQQIDS